ncbi:MAG TPA: histidine phosphatase family protein [Fimbriimonadaceae bacterium]|nr:histidine phosphatase family protein [Fimbriimonadaceae bacterium]
MTNLRLHLLRHGQTQFSEENAFCGSGLDPDLTTAGRRMAQDFADHYGALPWAAMYSSTLIRAANTAKPIGKAYGIEVLHDAGLSELAYGEWEGQSMEAVMDSHPEAFAKWVRDPAWHAPTGGETANEVACRALNVVDRVRRDFVGGNILFISHKATIRILLCSLLGLDVALFRHRFSCPVASVSIVEFTDAGPMLISLADCAHLSDDLRALPGT